jgi:glycosyltransferase involved in cell wall biosynthesis
LVSVPIGPVRRDLIETRRIGTVTFRHRSRIPRSKAALVGAHLTNSLRILVLHNFYRSENASGENLSVLDEIAALRERGHQVEVFSVASDEILKLNFVRRASHFHRPLGSITSHFALTKLLHEFRPDVALVENLYPFLSPALLETLRSNGVPTVAAVRNYRLSCVASTHWRDNRPCYDCWSSRTNMPAIVNGCYNQSPLLTVPMALALSAHQRRFLAVDHFLPVSRHVARYLGDLGIASSKITVRPNFIRDPGPSTTTGRGVVYAGRLSEEKGFGLLLDAWLAADVSPSCELTVLGTGPLQDRLDGLPSSARVNWLGLRPHAEVMAAMRAAAVAVVPSMWNEPFGRGVIEAASLSRAALVSDHGALPETVVAGTTGWVADATVPGFVEGLEAAADPQEAARRGRAARERYEDHYTEEVSVQVLESTLASVAAHGTTPSPAEASPVTPPSR